MKRLMNFLRGMADLRVTGLFPERLINLCAQNGVEFWGVEWLDEHTLRLTVRRRHLRQLRELAQRVGCDVSQEGSRGLPDFLIRFRTRYAFLTGLALSLCAVAFLSQFILTVEVKGNERVPTAVILSQLRQLGVRPGVYGPGLDRQQLAQETLREAVASPERIDEEGYFDIVAEADGIVTHIEPEQGDAAVQEGDTVLAGEVLISGTVTMEPPKYSDLPTRYYQTHARGRVWARTWRTLTAQIPLEANTKVYTGEDRKVWSLKFLDRRIEIFGNSSISWPFYDKITIVRQLTLPGERALPISLIQESYRAYDLESRELDREAAQRLLEEQLKDRLERLIGEDGQIDSIRFSAKVEDGQLKVTAQAECQEEIGKEVPGSAPPEEHGESEEQASS